MPRADDYNARLDAAYQHLLSAGDNGLTAAALAEAMGCAAMTGYTMIRALRKRRRIKFDVRKVRVGARGPMTLVYVVRVA